MKPEQEQDILYLQQRLFNATNEKQAELLYNELCKLLDSLESLWSNTDAENASGDTDAN